LLDHAGVNSASDIAGFDQLVRLEQRSHSVVAHTWQAGGDGEKGCARHLGLNWAQPSEEVQYRLGPTLRDRRELPAQRALPEFIMAEPLHGSDVNRRPDIEPENASPKTGNAPNPAVSASLEMQNQGSSHEPVRYPEPMQRVALLT
jgi:hypothetical protein